MMIWTSWGKCSPWRRAVLKICCWNVIANVQKRHSMNHFASGLNAHRSCAHRLRGDDMTFKQWQTLHRLVDAIHVWREEPTAGYDSAIEVLCDIDDTLTLMLLEMENDDGA